MDMVSACQLYWGNVQKSNNGLCQQFCLEESCPSRCLPGARHFSSSLHASGAFQASVPVLELREDESEYVHGWAIEEEFPWNPAVSVFHSLNFHWFAQPEVMGISFPGTGALH